jgi:hypothetical protein
MKTCAKKGRNFNWMDLTTFMCAGEGGKNPMSVLNAVRFKLICRIFSVIKRNEEYQKEYKKLQLKIWKNHRIQQTDVTGCLVQPNLFLRKVNNEC